MTVTCDTPSTASRRFRRVNSAKVRSSIALACRSAGVAGTASDRTPSSITSPMMDEMGAITGLASGGSRSRASCSFSATTCRSR